MPCDVIANAELAASISGPHLYPLWHRAKRKQTVCPAQHPGFLFAEVMQIRKSGLAHLKQLQGTGLSVFLGLCVSDHSTAQGVKDAGGLEPFGQLCAPPETGIKYSYDAKPCIEEHIESRGHKNTSLSGFSFQSVAQLFRIHHEDKTLWAQHISRWCVKVIELYRGDAGDAGLH